MVRQSAGVGDDPDQLSFVVGDAELTERAAPAADEDDEVGAVDVVYLAAHEPRSGEYHRGVWLERRFVELDVFLRRMRGRNAQTLTAGLVRAEHRGMRQSRASSGDDE